MDEGTIAKVVVGAESTSRPLVREFVVDFLGALIPGLIFLVALIPALLIPCWIVQGQLLPNFAGTTIRSLMENVDPAVTILLLVIPGVLVMLALAYFCGHLFFRQDPKKPDLASFKRINRRPDSLAARIRARLRIRGRAGDAKGMARWVHVKADPKEAGEWVAKVEFPYHFLKNYLLERGMRYLANAVPWGSDTFDVNAAPDDHAFHRRAKHFANALKLRIQIGSPAAYASLARNEAHVRLSSSMWYVSRSLMRASAVGTVLCIAPVIALNGGSLILQQAAMPAAMIFPVSVGIAAFIVRHAIERALHYQREREVLFILETAYWLSLRKPKVSMFAGLADLQVSTTTKDDLDVDLREKQKEGLSGDSGDGAK